MINKTKINFYTEETTNIKNYFYLSEMFYKSKLLEHKTLFAN